MSHNIGRLITITPIGIGPNHPINSINYDHPQEPGQPSRFVILHFNNASFPANNRLEVNLGYGKDVFNSASGSEFWTRPINVNALPSGNIPINYIQDGAATGGVQLVGFGRAHRIHEGANPCTFTNCDIFLHTNPYVEPVYDTYWICGANATTCFSDPKWKNAATLPNDLRDAARKAACMIISAHGDHLSTCSATLIADDLVFSAGHCLAISGTNSPADLSGALSASVVLGYQTDASGNKPATYEPKIFKVLEVVEYNFTTDGKDYLILRIDISNGTSGISPLPMRTDLPAPGEELFAIHHPNGAVKKASPKTGDFFSVLSVSTNSIRISIDVAGGSSGSGLYDKLGNVVGTLSAGGRRDNLGNCSSTLSYFPTATLLKIIGTTPPPPTVNRDVMIVIDRSGSMAQITQTGRTKIEEARDAASLFISMVQQGGGNRTGLVSFANAPNLDHGLAPNNNANKNTLIGPAPYSGGIVGGLIPNGTTTIGGGLSTAISQFSGSATKDEVILLLTDGMQNTPPMIEDVEASFGNRRFCIVGYGDASNLDGPTLARLAILHDGSYTVAQDELTLKKFFASCFGNIFESGFLMDPDFHLPRTTNKAKPMPFNICGEESATIVVGWDRVDSQLTFNISTPNGNTISLSHANVITDRGKTWVYARLTLPIDGEQDGLWQVNVFRPSQGEFTPAPHNLNYFVNVIAKGGPKLHVLSQKKFSYTGNSYNPLVRLSYDTNVSPSHASVELFVKRPLQSTGNILVNKGMQSTLQIDGDTIPPIYASLIKIKDDQAGKLVDYETLNFKLFDDGVHEDGSMGPDGIFGNPIKDLFNAQGLFHSGRLQPMAIIVKPLGKRCGQCM
ncbi:VWA domain-containing protein [Aegicerativicinus sediminis]|uniref:VWA domain-containing protein n=1 Tax=Aegicerativicinus sediminis TaxID=2893202 RepID=UPI001E60A81D|nr:VWA domain-containing protein [Aegicerativicinus sediminis]